MNPRTGEEYFYKLDNLLLISTQHLRSKFASRWKEETKTDWGSSESQGRQVIEGLRQQIKKSLQSSQMAIIEKGCLSEWSLPTLSLVLQHFGRISQLNKHEAETLKALTRLRNELTLNQKKKFSREEFNTKLEIIKKSLRSLGTDDEKCIKKIIDDAGVTSSAAALESAQKLYEKAESHLQQGELDEAIELYGEAISVPSLLPVHQAAALVKRAECYLVAAKKQKEDKNYFEYDLSLAITASDALTALAHDEFSWTACRIVGQWHMMEKNFKEALFYFQKAVRLAPLEQQPKEDLILCKCKYMDSVTKDKKGSCNQEAEENGVEKPATSSAHLHKNGNGGTSDPREENCQRENISGEPESTSIQNELEPEITSNEFDNETSYCEEVFSVLESQTVGQSIILSEECRIILKSQQTVVDKLEPLSEELVAEVQAVEEVESEPVSDSSAQPATGLKVESEELPIPNVHENVVEHTCTEAEVLEEITTSQQREKEVMEQTLDSVSNSELSAHAEAETKLASDSDGFQYEGATSESFETGLPVKHQNELEPELTLDEQLPLNESKVSSCEELVSFLQSETNLVDQSMLLAEEPANIMKDQQFVDELVLASEEEVPEVQPVEVEEPPSYSYLTLQAFPELVHKSTPDNSYSTKAEVVEKMTTSQNEVEIVEPEQVSDSIPNSESNKVEMKQKNRETELKLATTLEHDEDESSESGFADFAFVQQAPVVQRPNSLELSHQDYKQPASLMEVLDLTQNELPSDFNETVAEEPTLNEEIPNIQPQNGKITSFLIKLPLYCLALYCFAKGHFILGVCMVFYILYLLGR